MNVTFFLFFVCVVLVPIDGLSLPPKPGFAPDHGWAASNGTAIE